jgi:hypothetical protein
LHFEAFKPNFLLEHHSFTLKSVAIVNTFNGRKKFEISGIAQGGNMLKNSKHFVNIINEEQKPKIATPRHAGMAVNHVRQEIIKPECGQSYNIKTRQASSPRNSSSSQNTTGHGSLGRSPYTLHQPAWCPFSIFSMTKSDNSTKLVTVKWPFLKPCCMTEICGRMIGVNSSQIIFSKNFGITDKMDIPR